MYKQIISIEKLFFCLSIRELHSNNSNTSFNFLIILKNLVLQCVFINYQINQSLKVLNFDNFEEIIKIYLAEFQRAVRISTGFELESNIMGLIFRIFDADDDQHL